MTAIEILDLLNKTDELEHIEAKTASQMGKSILETVCAFANTVGIGEGIILAGAKKDEHSLFPAYEAVGVPDPDQFQQDLASQCATSFNRPVRPRVSVEQGEWEVNGCNKSIRVGRAGQTSILQENCSTSRCMDKSG